MHACKRGFLSSVSHERRMGKLGFVRSVLAEQKTVVKTIALLIMGLYVCFAMHGMRSVFCGHESYADEPLNIIWLLMLFAVVLIIMHRKNIVLAVVYEWILMLSLMV